MFSTYGAIYLISLLHDNVTKVKIQQGVYESSRTYKWYPCLWAHTEDGTIAYTKHWRPSAIVQAVKDIERIGYTVVSKEVYKKIKVIV